MSIFVTFWDYHESMSEHDSHSIPHWHRRSAGEHRIPVLIVVLVVIALQFLLLEVAPRAERFGRVGHRVVGGKIRTAKFHNGAEMRQDLRAIQALPQEGIVRQAVVLTPADLDGHEIFETRLLNELRQCTGIAKDIGQPQYGTISIPAEMLAEVHAPQQELARE